MRRVPLQGLYSPKHPEKYIGEISTITYRSSWERMFFKYCDETPGILRWGSEEFSIQYVSPIDNRFHRYFPDIYLEVAASTGKQTFVIEIKPEYQTVMPPKRKNTKRYLTEVATVSVNHAKWQAAQQFCQERHWKFLVLTERHLFKGL